MTALIPPGTDLCLVPLAMNPSGAPPDFLNGPNLLQELHGSISTFIILTTLFVGARLYNNFRQQKKWFLDDYFCLGAWMLHLPRGILYMMQTKATYHAWNTPICVFDARYLKINAATTMMNPITLFLIKSAIFLLYMRLFGNIAWMRYACWAGVSVSGVVYLAQIVPYAILQFPHGDETWGLPLLMSAARAGPAHITIASYTVLCDLVLIALPLPIVYGLNTSFWKKIGLCTVFLAGLLGTAAAIVNLRFVIRSTTTTTNTAIPADTTWDVVRTTICAYAEVSTGLCIACVPASVGFFKYFIHETTLGSTLRSLLTSSTSSPPSRRSSANDHHKSLPSSRSSDRSGPRAKSATQSYELRRSSDNASFAHKNASQTGIYKSVEISQTSRDAPPPMPQPPPPVAAWDARV